MLRLFVITLFLFACSPPKKITTTLNILGTSTPASEHMFLGQVLPKHQALKLTDKDKMLIQKLLYEALEKSPSFVEHTWTNTTDSHKGKVSTGPVEKSNTQKCRRFDTVTYIKPDTIHISGKACRNSEKEQWEIIGENSN